MIVRGEPDVARSLAAFHERLADTVAWCAPRADAAHPRTCLRTPALAARPLEPDYFTAVRTVGHNRGFEGTHRFVPHCGSREGRLLVYYPDAELADGAAEVESEGFFDVYNCPPWDTWVGIFQDDHPPSSSFAIYLVAWVPQVLVDLASRGIEVNPEECIRWLDDADCELRRLLAGAPRAPGFFDRLFRRD